MPREYAPPDDREVLTADTKLTERGVEAARHVSTVLDEEGKKAARRTAERSYGWTTLGYGVARHVYETAETGRQQRVAFDITGPELMDDNPYMRGSTPSVLKVSTANHGQTATEVAQWEHINGDSHNARGFDDPAPGGWWTDLRPYLAPISDYDRDEYRWEVMRRLDPTPPTNEPTVGDSLGSEIQKQTGWIASDLHEDNIAYYNGDKYVIDYGHMFAWSGWTPAERIEMFEDALEQIGCRDVRWQRQGRKEARTMFGSPARLPGKPYERRASEVFTTKGGRLKSLELYGSIIPSNGATRVEVENALDEVLDTPAMLRNVRAEVSSRDGEWAPKVRATYGHGQGPSLSETQAFITEFYDRYDTIFPAIANEYVPASNPDPPELDDEQTVLQDIIDDIEAGI